MCTSSPDPPPVPEQDTPAAPPTYADRDVQTAGDRQRRRAAGAGGMRSTILTGGQSQTQSAQTGNTLLGGST